MGGPQQWRRRRGNAGPLAVGRADREPDQNHDHCQRDARAADRLPVRRSPLPLWLTGNVSRAPRRSLTAWPLRASTPPRASTPGGASTALFLASTALVLASLISLARPMYTAGESTLDGCRRLRPACSRSPDPTRPAALASRPT